MKSFDFWGLEAVISFSVYLLSKASRNHAEMNRELVAYDFRLFEVLCCGIQTCKFGEI